MRGLAGSQGTLTAGLKWNECTGVPKYCDLEWHYDGPVTVNLGGGFSIIYRIEGFLPTDFMRLGAVTVNGASYIAAANPPNPWIANATTTTTVGGVDVDWTWPSYAQPVNVLIKGTGDSFEIDHTSPSVTYTIYDSTGNPVAAGAAIPAGGAAIPATWTMQFSQP